MLKSASAAGAFAAAALAASLATGPAAAADATLKICASTKEAPYSAAGGAGFENKIAVRLAEAMGRKPEFVWTDKFGVYLVRDFLEPKACDVVFGVDTGDERLLTTSPLYRTGYVFVSRTDENFDGHRWQDIARPDFGRFAVRFYSPAEVMLKYTGKWEDNAAYLYGLINFKSSRNSYNQVEASRLVSEVAAGEADLAIAFAPDVARYVKSSGVPVRMTMIEDDITRSDGQVIPLKYDQSIGVRKDDTALLAEIETALGKIRGDIDQILAEEGIPLLPPSS